MKESYIIACTWPPIHLVLGRIDVAPIVLGIALELVDPIA